jgi:hypothetical protein
MLAFVMVLTMLAQPFALQGFAFAGGYESYNSENAVDYSAAGNGGSDSAVGSIADSNLEANTASDSDSKASIVGSEANDDSEAVKGSSSDSEVKTDTDAKNGSGADIIPGTAGGSSEDEKNLVSNYFTEALYTEASQTYSPAEVNGTGSENGTGGSQTVNNPTVTNGTDSGNYEGTNGSQTGNNPSQINESESELGVSGDGSQIVNDPANGDGSQIVNDPANEDGSQTVNEPTGEDESQTVDDPTGATGNEGDENKDKDQTGTDEPSDESNIENGSDDEDIIENPNPDENLTPSDEGEMNENGQLVFTVKFYDYNLELIGEEQKVVQGESAVEPAEEDIPILTGAAFTGWNTDEWTNVNKNLSVYALYDMMFQPLGTTVNVTNWDQFRKAYNNAGVSRIVLNVPINRANGYEDSKYNLKARTVSLQIDGQGHGIFFTSGNTFLIDNNAAGTLEIQSLGMVRGVGKIGAGDALVKGNGKWKIYISGELTQYGNPFMLANTPNSTVYFGGTTTWTNAGNKSAINAMKVQFMQNCKASISAERNVIELNADKGGSGVEPSFEAFEGAIVNLNSTGNGKYEAGALVMYSKNPNSSSSTSDKSKPYLMIRGATVTASSYAQDIGNDAGTFVIQGRGGTISITGGAKVTVKADRQAAFLTQVNQSSFEISGSGTHVVLEQNTGSSSASGVSAAMRFRYIDDQNLTIKDNATLRVTKLDGNAAAIRFGEGKRNSFIAETGGKLFVEHRGGTGSTGHDPVSSDTLNAAYSAIQFADNDFSFIVRDKSAIELIARAGPALEAGANDNGLVKLEKGGIFIARGNTASANRGIFAMDRNCQFIISEPLYFDFANTRSDGGLVFEVNGTGGSQFSSNNSDIAVWNRGWDIKGNPSKMWNTQEFSFSLTGTNYETFYSSSKPSYFSASNFGRMTNYTRINGNNYPPTVKQSLKPTNADKYIYGEVTMLEAYDVDFNSHDFVPVSRPAWDGEMYVLVEEFSKRTGATNYYVGQTVRTKTLPDNTRLEGVFVIDLGRFAEVGDTYTVIDGWVGSRIPGEARRHAQIDFGTVTVVDKTPPIPAQSTSTLYNDTKQISGTWKADGVHNADKPMKIWVERSNGTPLKEGGDTKYGSISGESGGTWEYTFPDGTTLTEGETLRVILGDANGNNNPNKGLDVAFRDAKFAKALEIKVQKANYSITAQNAIIGYDIAETITGNEQLIALVKGKGMSYTGDTSLPADVEVKSTDFKAVEGVYNVTLQIKDDNSYTASAKIRVLPRDVVIADGEHYIVGANHIYLSVQDAIALVKSPKEERAATLMNLSKAVAWNKNTLEEDEAAYDSDTLGDDSGSVSEGEYKAIFKAVKEPDAKVEVKIFVNSGHAPTLEVTSPIEIDINDKESSPYIKEGEFQYKEGVTVKDEDHKDLSVANVEYGGFLDLDKAGIYLLEYKVVDPDKNVATAPRVVVMNDGTYQVGDDDGKLDKDDYIVRAKGFAINQKDVLAVPPNTQDVQDEQVKERSEASAWNSLAVPSAVTIEYDDSNRYTNAVGSYLIKILSEVNNAVKRDIVAVVTNKDILVEGDRYDIGANNVTINTAKATEILGDDGDQLGEELIALTGATAWDRVNGMGVVTVVYDKAKSGEFKAAEGEYETVFYVDADPDVRVSVKVTVTDGNAPTLTVPAITVIKLGDEYKPMVGVKAYDVEDKDLTAQVVVDPSTLDTNTAGVYSLTYSVTDSDFNTKTQDAVLVVDDGSFVIDDEYILSARSFVIKNSEVEAAHDIDGQIIEKSKAKAWNAVTAALLNNDDLLVADRGGYTAFPSEYKVKIAIAAKPAVSRGITAVVTDKGNIGTSDKYAIAADDARISKNQAQYDVSDNNLKKWTNAIAWQLIDYKVLTADEIGVGSHEIAATENVYPVNFFVKAETTTNTNANINVSDLKPPTLIVETPIEISKGGAYEKFDGVNAFDNEASEIIPNEKIVISGDEVDVNTAGVYRVVYTVTDSNSMQATAIRVVIVNDGTYKKDNHYITRAKSFAIKASDVNTSSAAAKDAQIIIKSRAQSWDLDTGIALGAVVKSDGGYTNAENNYNITIASSRDANITRKISALVTDRDEMTELEEYVIAANKAKINTRKAKAMLEGGKLEEELIALMKAEAWKAWGSEVIAPVEVALNSTDFTAAAQGTYDVTFQIKDSDAPTVTVELTVDDGTPPVLIVPRMREIVEGNPFNYAFGVQAYDAEDEELSEDDVTWSAITYNGEALDKNENDANVISGAGLYQLKYSLTDSDFNTVTKNMVLVVNDGHYAIGGNYIVYADSFAIKVAGVAKEAKDQQIINKSKAKAWFVSPNVELYSVSAAVKDDGGYTDAADTYRIVIGAKDNPSATINGDVEKVIYAIVSDKDEIVEGIDYIIGANNISINLTTAQRVIENPDELMNISQVQAQAWHKENMHETEVQVDSHTIKAEVGKYIAVFSVMNSPETKVTIAATVYDGGDPVLEVSTPVEIDIKDLAKSGYIIDGDFNYMLNVTAYNEAEKKTSITDAVWWSGIVDLDVEGVTVLRYNVTNDEGNSVQAPRVVVVNDGSYKVDNDYVVHARNYAISSGAVAEAMLKGGDAVNEQIKTHSYAKAWNAKTGMITGVSVDPGSYSSAPAIYKVVVSARDKAESKIEINAWVMDKDHVSGGDEEGGGNGESKYIISANNVILRISEAAKITDEQLIDRAKAEVALRADFKPSDSNINVTHNVVGALGEYYATFAVANEPTTKITVRVTVVTGDSPVIDAPDVVVVPEGSTPDYKENVTVTDPEDGDLDPDDIVVNNPPSTDEAGVYEVEREITDSDGNTTKEKDLVVVDDGTFAVGTDYILKAADFVISKASVTGENAQILSKSGAKAWKIKPFSKADPYVADNGGYTATVGEYPIKIAVQGESSLVRSINAIVKDVVEGGGDPGEGGGGDPGGGDPGEGGGDPGTGGDEDGYIIGANHITMRVSEARAIIDGNLNDKLIDLAKAQAWKSKGLTPVTAAVVEVGSHTMKAAVGVYTVTFKVTDDPDTTATVNVNVVSGESPSLEAPDVIVVPEGGDPDYTEDVKVEDPEDKDLSNKDVVVNNPPDTDESGVYEVEREVTDSDGNTTTDKGILIVDDGTYVFNDKYILKAAGFIIEKTSVTGENAQILSKSGAKAWSIRPFGTTAAAVKDNGGYKAEVGSYPITVAVKMDSTLVRNITAIVKDVVVDGGGDPGTGGGDPGEGGGGDPGTGGGDPGEGGGGDPGEGGGGDPGTGGDSDGGYVIGANHMTMRVSEARAIIDGKLNSKLIELAAAQAWQKKGSAPVTPAAVEVGSHTMKAAVGVYTVTFKVTDDPDTAATVNVNVVSGESPSLEAPDVIVVPEGSEPDYTEDVKVEDPEDENLSNKDVVVNNPPDTDESGVYEVEREVTDSDGNTTTDKGILVVDDGTYAVNTKYILKAAGFIIDKTSVTGENAQILSKSGAKAWSIKPFGTTAAAVKDNGGYKAEVGNYPITIAVKMDSTLVRNIIAIVKDVVVDGGGDPGEGGGGNPGEGGGGDPGEGGGGNPGEGGGDPGEGGGGNPGEGGGSDPGTGGDNGGGYVIGANHMKMRVSEARTIIDGKLNSKLIELAVAQAWQKKGQAPVTPAAVEVASHTMKAAVGVYTVTFKVTDDPDTAATVNVTVVSGEAPSMEVPELVVVPEGSDPDYTDGVEVYDPEDEDLTKDDVVVNNPPSTGEGGVYEVEREVTDSDDNTTTGKGIVVVDDGTVTVDPEREYIVRAKNFAIKAADVKGSDAEILSNSSAQAWRVSPFGNVEAVVTDNGGYKAHIGTYDIVIAAADKTAVKRNIKAIVKDEVFSGDSWVIGANNFKLKLGEVSSLNEATIIKLANAEAWRKSNTSPTAVVVAVNDIKAKEGTYNVTFAVKADTNVTISVKATVVNDTPGGGKIDPKPPGGNDDKDDDKKGGDEDDDTTPPPEGGGTTPPSGGDDDEEKPDTPGTGVLPTPPQYQPAPQAPVTVVPRTDDEQEDEPVFEAVAAPPTNNTPAQPPSYGGNIRTPSRNAATLAEIISEGIPTLRLGNLQIPLTGGKMGDSVWALMNLVLAIFGLVLAFMTFLRLMRRRTQSPKIEGKARNMSLLSVVMGVAAAALFLITEDVSLLMVLFDMWTAPTALLVAVEIVLMVVSKEVHYAESGSAEQFGSDEIGV